MNIEHKEWQLCSGSKLIILRWLFLNLSFTESLMKNRVWKIAVWRSQSIFELLVRNIGVKCSSYWGFKIHLICLEVKHAPRNSRFFVARILENANQVLRIFVFLCQIPLLFCGTWYPSTLILNHRERSISQLSLVSFYVFCQPLAISFIFSIFLWNFFSSICREIFHTIVSIPLHKIQRAFITTTSWEAQHYQQYFERFPQLPVYFIWDI